MTGRAAGALVGLVGGAGVWLLLTRLALARRPSFAERIAPYVPQTAPQPRASGQSLVATAAARLDRIVGGRTALQRRLSSAGDRMTVEQYRVSQVLWAAGGALPGAVLLAAGALLARPTLSLAGAALVIAGLAGGVVARDSALSHEIAERDALILSELPAAADLMSLAVSAGEGPLGALQRVSRAADSPLHHELRRVLDDVRSGIPLVQALDLFAARTSVAPLARFLDALVVATERGTPLADLLRSQASDVRETAKRELIEAGGRKEIAMMVPVVFLTLPTVVLFAAFPAYRALSFVSH